MEPRVAQELRDVIRHRQGEMTDLLAELAKAESPSAVPESQTVAQSLLCDALSNAGYKVDKIPGDRTGGQLLALPADAPADRPRQLLLGHCDTVWPLGTLKKMPVEIRDGCLHGPGVYDMKAGLVQAICAVAAIRAIGRRATVTPVLFINSDEEIGSPESSEHIRRLATGVDRVFVMEPSLGPAGKLKTARKGVGRFTIRVIGHAAHAGLDPEKGVSAILELSYLVQRLFALNDPSRGVTVNVGTIDGGLRPNVIAPESRAEVDVRVATEADARRVEQEIRNLQPSTPGIRLEIQGRVGRPPMERTPGNQRLWELARRAAGQLGIALEEGSAGGGSDGNLTSQLAPTLDGLGAVGDGAHAPNERVDLEKMVERSALLATLLVAPPIDMNSDPELATSQVTDPQPGG